MAIFSFSTKPEDDEGELEVARLKRACLNSGVSFSHVIIKLIKEHNDKARSQNQSRS